MNVVRQGKLFVCTKKRSKFDWLNRRSDKNYRNLRFKQYSVRLWRGNDEKPRLDLSAINDVDRPIGTIDLSNVVGCRRIPDKDFCCRLIRSPSPPSSSSKIKADAFIAGDCETDLHDWITDVFSSIGRQRLIPSGLGPAYPVYLIRADRASAFDAATGPDLWICVDTDEIKMYEMSTLKFVVSSKSTDVRSCQLVVDDCHQKDRGKILALRLATARDANNSNNAGATSDEDSCAIRLFSLNADQLLLSIRSITSDRENFQMRNVLPAKLTARFKKPSKSAENLHEKTFSIGRRLNCLSASDSPPPDVAAAASDSESASSGGSSTNAFRPQLRRRPSAPPPSKEELEKRENEKLAERRVSRRVRRRDDDDDDYPGIAGGDSASCRFSLSKSVDNLRCSGLTAAGTPRTSRISPRGYPAPSLPPRRRENFENSKSSIVDGYDKLPNIDRYKPRSNNGYASYARLPDKSELFLNLKSNHRSVDSAYKILSPSPSLLKKSSLADGYDVLHTNPKPDTSSGYDALPAVSGSNVDLSSGYHVLPLSDRRKIISPFVVSPEAEV